MSVLNLLALLDFFVTLTPTRIDANAIIYDKYNSIGNESHLKNHVEIKSISLFAEQTRTYRKRNSFVKTRRVLRKTKIYPTRLTSTF